jgi:hypothetical protein
MTTYRNATWTARNYECTNVVFQVVPDGDVPRRFNGNPAPAGEWVVAKDIPSDMAPLGGFGGYAFYGYM